MTDTEKKVMTWLSVHYFEIVLLRCRSFFEISGKVCVDMLKLKQLAKQRLLGSSYKNLWRICCIMKRGKNIGGDKIIFFE